MIGLNDTQNRILTIMRNIGDCAACDVQQRGNLSKPVAVIEMNMRNMARSGHIKDLGKDMFRLEHPSRFAKSKSEKTQATKAMSKTGKGITMEKPTPDPITTVGELEDAVQQDKGSNVLDAVDRLRDKLKEKPAYRQIYDFQLKYDLCCKLAEITEDSIADVLLDIRDDLAYLHSFGDKSDQ